MESSHRLAFKEVLLWVLCLAMIAVGAKNFEIGMSIDAPFYSAVSRNMARSGNWMEMSASTPDFIPYAEHPHLGYWTQSVFFKFFGATDPIARIPGQIFYVLCLLVLFFGIRELSSQRTAIWTVILLWSWDRFSNFFASAYLDPGLLFFSGTSLFLLAWDKKKAGPDFYGTANRFCAQTKNKDAVKVRPCLFLTFTAGVLLGLGIMQKGMVNAGFGPAFLFLFYQKAKIDFKKSIKSLLIFLSGLTVMLGIYFLLVRLSTVPNFFELYWASQSKQRFGVRWDWQRLWGAKYWWLLLKDTHFLLPLTLFSLRSWKQPSVQLPLILFATFSTMYACANLNGGQYWITLLPWVAWLIAENFLAKIPVDSTRLVPLTRNIAIVLLFIVQYIPFRVHSAKPPVEVETISRLKNEMGAKYLVVDNYPMKTNFGDAGVYVWYNDLKAIYPEKSSLPKNELEAIYLLLNNDGGRKKELSAHGWCPFQSFEKTSVWISCQSPMLFKNASLLGSRPKKPLINS